MSDESDGQGSDSESFDGMLWEEVRKKKFRPRSDSGSEPESTDTVKKRSRSERDGNKIKDQMEGKEVWKVIVVFEQKGGPHLHPIHITKAIEEEIGKIKHARFMGNGRLLIFAASEKQREIILKKDTLNKAKMSSHIPGIATGKRGVITGIPVAVSIEEIKNSLKGGDIVDAKRLTKGKEKLDSMSILIWFKNEMPSKVQMGFMCYPVREYVPHPIRCFKCQRFGHVATQCRGKLRCAKCGNEHEYGQCGDDVELKCCNCGGQHSAAYGGCVKQKEAKEVQKYKIAHNVSYAEAIKSIVKDKRQEKPAVIYAPKVRSTDSNKPCTSTENCIEEINQQTKTYRATRPICECKARISDETLLIRKNEFIAFICSVVNVTMLHSKKSDKIKSVVEAANDFLGIITKADDIHKILNLKYGGSQNG